MPTVPYQPIPSVAAQGTPLPELRSSVPIEAFGSEVAQAITSAGRVAAGVGDALFERALFLQRENNAAEARNAEAMYTIKAGKLHADFNTLEGDQAIKAYPKYTQELKVLRESIKSSLRTADSQRQFDGASMGTLSRSIFNASSHLASQTKKYTLDSYEAKRGALREEVAANPNDDVTFQRAWNETVRSIDEEGKLRGLPPEAVSNAKLAETSKLIAGRIEQQSREFPLTGPKLLEDNRSRLTKTDADRLQRVTDAQRDSYGTAKISTDLITTNMNEDGTLKKPLEEIRADAKKLAETFSPDDPQFATKTVRQLDAEIRAQQYARNIETKANEQNAYKILLDNPKIKNKFDFVQDPEGLAVYKSLSPKKQADLDGIINRYITARDKQDNDQSMLTLRGMKLDPNSQAEFLNVDPTDPKWKLSKTNIGQVLEWQRKALANTEEDPNVKKYMKLMQGAFPAELEALNVYALGKNNRDDYFHFIGALQQSVMSFTEQNKRPPSEKEFREQIAPILLLNKRQTWSNFFFGPPGFHSDGGGNVFTHDTSSKPYVNFKNKLTDEMTKAGAAPPTDEEVYKLYSRKTFNDLYKAKMKKPDDKR